MTIDQHLLSSIADQLNNDALNYSVFLQSYSVPISSVHGDSKEYIRHAIGGGAIVENIQAVSGKKVLETIEAAITFAGDAAAGPAISTLKSSAFTALRVELLSALKATITEAKSVEQFWLSEGHPAYPVYWDFAFLFTLSKEVVIFVGSSSD